jgi:hypothetical protein
VYLKESGIRRKTCSWRKECYHSLHIWRRTCHPRASQPNRARYLTYLCRTRWCSYQRHLFLLYPSNEYSRVVPRVCHLNTERWLADSPHVPLTCNAGDLRCNIGQAWPIARHTDNGKHARPLRVDSPGNNVTVLRDVELQNLDFAVDSRYYFVGF